MRRAKGAVPPRGAKDEGPLTAWWESVHRAFAEFLTIPSATILGFLLLAASLYVLEQSDAGWLRPLRSGIQSRILGDAQSTADLLASIAGGLITVTSITISLLLIALQQSAASLSNAVFDQFLRRRHNQFYFGFFVGASLYALLTLATVNEPFNPVLGASLAIVITLLALFMLIVLLYTTINQMRPDEILGAIHNITLAARDRQQSLLEKTRRTATVAGTIRASARSARHGYVTRIDVGALGAALENVSSPTEVVFRVSIGTFVATGDVLAEVVSSNSAEADAIAADVPGVVRLERSRDIACDPGDGIEELETIAWTSISTSKSNPDPGLFAIRILRDLLTRWAEGQSDVGRSGEGRPPLAIVYVDTVPERLMAAIESLAVVSTESMQHQAFAEVMRALASSFDRLPEDQQRRAEQLILRAISGLGDHILTAYLEASLVEIAQALSSAGCEQTASAVSRARVQLGRSVGHLHSRATRVEAARQASGEME